ncbi:MAG: CAP domain-containing protein [Pseudomonadota bacterium]
MGDGVSGPVVVSNVPLYVGIPEPAAAIVAGAVVEPEQAEARLLVLVNEARAAAGLNKVQPDAELREIALAHSTDMADHHFFGHVSPRTGTPTDRVHRSGVLVSAAGENVASAPTPEVAHEGLMGSPGHRANILRPDWTHVGIGVRKGEDGLLVTEVFWTTTRIPQHSRRAPLKSRRRSRRFARVRTCQLRVSIPFTAWPPKQARMPTLRAKMNRTSPKPSEQRSIER